MKNPIMILSLEKFTPLRKKIGFTLLVITFFLFLFSMNFKLTGNVINDDPPIVSIKNIFIILFLVASFIVLASSKGLDVLVIPTGPDRQENIERTDKAIEEYKKSGAKYFLISGKIADDRTLKNSRRADIYRRLRKAGIKPKQMKIEGKSANTIENILYTLNKLSEEDGPLKVGFISYPGHVRRMKDIYNKAVKENLVDPERIQFKKIETAETKEERDYEAAPIRKFFHRYLLSKIKKHRRSLYKGIFPFINRK